MLHNSFNRTGCLELPVCPQMQTILTAYFEAHPVEETKERLADMLQGWVDPFRVKPPSNMDVADMVFFVSNTTIMVRKVAAFKCLPGHVTEVIEELPAGYVEELLNEVLQAWICPVPFDARPLKRMPVAVSTFRLLNKLVAKLEAVAELEGGVLCN